jgi:hypothetical protein
MTVSRPAFGRRKPGTIRGGALAVFALVLFATAPLSTSAREGHSHKVASQPAAFGSIDFENSCATSVQAKLRSAVAMLHSFAADAQQFVDVAGQDPGCAIAWWGAAMAARGNPLVGELDHDGLEVGRQYLARARKLKATSRERGYLDAMEVYYREYPNGGQASRTKAYEAAMERVFRGYPGDVEAAAFYGLSIVEAADLNSRNYDQQLKAGKVLETLLAQHPDHPGALHYLIHAYDFAPLAKRGLPAARRYAGAAPASYHARHMPSHIFTMLGLWDESIQANRESNALIDPKHADGAVDGDIASMHAFDFIVYARLQLAEDKWVAADLQALNKAGRAATLMSARFALERSDWEAAANLPLAHDAGFDDVTARFARALGAARLGKVEEAGAELTALRALRDGVERTSGAYWAGYVDIYAGAVDAWIARAAGHPDDALRRMQVAADLDDGREKSIAMENRLLPMRELLGELLLETGKPGAAEVEFEKSARDAPNRYRGLLGAARAAAGSGDRPKARAFYGQLLKLAGNADSRPADISEARNYLSQ